MTFNVINLVADVLGPAAILAPAANSSNLRARSSVGGDRSGHARQGEYIE